MAGEARGRAEHSFFFTASKISKAAGACAVYHEQRVGYWKSEYSIDYDRVKETAGVKFVEQQVTGGVRKEVVVDYGDGTAYMRMNEAWGKWNQHSDRAKSFRIDEALYATQGERAYELNVSDVHYYRMGGEKPEE